MKDQMIIVIRQTGAAASDLTFVLEEYALLFPETRHLARQLGFFSSDRIVFVYSALLSDLLQRDKREAAIAAMEARQDRTTDYQALLEDLRIHIQNTSLAEITGRQIPKREPKDPNVPITVVRSDGMLHVVERGVPWPIRTWPHEPVPEWW